MSAERFPEEFKIQAVKQVTEKGRSVAIVAEQLDISPNCLYLWLKRYGSNSEYYQELSEHEKRLCELEKELKRTQQERDLLKEAPCTLWASQRKVHVHKVPAQAIPHKSDVQGTASSPQWIPSVAQGPRVCPCERRQAFNRIGKTFLVRKRLCIWLS